MRNHPTIAKLFSLLFLIQFHLSAQNPATIVLCSNGAAATTTATNGTVFDSGGQQNGYQNGEYCTLLINPGGCVTNMAITVDQYATENCCDALIIYDGENENAPILGNLQTANIPATFTASSGRLFLKWYSDGSVTSNGFRAAWTSTVVNPVAPVVVISVNDDTPALTELVNFTATATNFPNSWEWNFGDGSTSSVQNPSHNYSSPGTYNAQLIVTNCHGLKDTAVQVITMQGAPHVTVNPSSFQLTTACADTARAMITVTNDGQGDLLYSMRGAASFGRRNVLIYTYAVNYWSLVGIQNLLSAYPDEYEVSLTGASDSAGLALDIVDMDILIIPEFPPSIDVWFIMSQNSVFQKFIDGGGSIVVCGSYYYNPYFSATSLIAAPDYYTTEVSYNTLSFPQIHAITQHMPALYTAPYFAGSMAFNDPNYVSLCNWNGASVVGYKEIGPGSVVYLGFNFQNVDTPLENLMTDALHWGGTHSAIVFSPNAGKLAPGESIGVEATFITEKVVAGIYSGQIEVNTNNPAEPVVVTSFDLTITGQALLQASQTTLTYNPVMQFTSNARTILVENPGCDTLHVQSITSDESAFSFSPAQLDIPPFAADSLSVIFNPQDTGLIQGNILLTGNADPVNIAVSGFAFGAPIASVSPSTLELTVNCGESGTGGLTFNNAGLGDLHLSTSQGFSNTGSDLKILIMNDLYFYYYIPLNIEYWITTAYPDAEIVRFDNTKPLNELPNYLQEANMVILPAIGGGLTQTYPQIGQYLKDYLVSGGSVLMTGTPYTTQLNDLGITTVDPGYNNLYGYALNVELQNHPLMEGVNPTEIVYDDVYTHHFTSPHFVTVARSVNDAVNHSSVGFEKVGAGTFIYLGQECEANYSTSIKLVTNAVAWAAKPRWVRSEQETLVVVPDTSGTVNILFNSEDLVAGQYHYNLLWHTDDPVQPTINIPVTLTVEGTSLLESTATNLNFGVIQQFAQKTLDIPFRNAGCDTLKILSITSSNPAFSIADFPAVVPAFQDREVALKFAPQSPGNQSSVITIESDGGTHTVSVSGLAVSAPVVSAVPGSLQIALSCDGSETVPLTLNNAGLGNLNFSIGSDNRPNNVAVLNYGATYYRLNNLRILIQQNIPNLHLIEIGNVNGQAFADSLQKATILLVPSLDYYNDPAYDAYAPAIEAFLENGGHVFVMGFNNAEPLVRMGLFPNFNVEGLGSDYVTVTYPTHQFVQGVPRRYIPNDNCIGGVFPGLANVKTIIAGPNSTYLGIRNLGAGNIVYWGHQFEYPLTDESQSILTNIFAWSHNPLPGGVHIVSTSGNIAAGGNNTFQVQFDGNGNPGGIYYGQIRVYSNDPQHNPLIIPVQLTMASTPCANFSYSLPPCSETVSFADSSINDLTSWYWQFGDGAEAFIRNPVHTYINDGDYTVTMVGCNNFGCDTVSRTLHVTAFEGPVAINCQPQTTGNCCGYGIYRVTIGTLDNQSGDGAEGYQDYSCAMGTDVLAGEQVPIVIQTGNQGNEYLRVWIDFNNNGLFNANEQAFSDFNYINHEGFITIPNSAVKNVRLRMRIVSDVNGFPTSCSDVQYGQAEDYYVVSKNAVGTAEPGAGISIKLYPNPAVGDVWMEVNHAEPGACQWEIMDLTGRVVYTGQKDQVFEPRQKVKLPELPAGTYLVKIQSGIHYQVEKLIKIERP